MAQNPYVNKVEYYGNTLIDISDTTATAEDVASGKIFYAKDGSRTTGTMASSSPDWTDRTHLLWSGDTTIGITGNTLSVDATGYRGLVILCRYNGSWNPTETQNVSTYDGNYPIIVGGTSYQYIAGCNVNMSNGTALLSIPAGTGHSTGGQNFWGNNAIEILNIYGIE